MNKTILVRIFSIKKGLEKLEDIKVIRIKSDKYNLLIMDDYVPIVGEINGNIDFKSDTTSLVMENIKGYYMLSNNVFNLIINET